MEGERVGDMREIKSKRPGDIQLHPSDFYEHIILSRH